MKLCIDPGHGGSDSGGFDRATGKREKDVVLNISYAMMHQATARGLQAILTRTGDKTVEIDTRYEIANRWGADLFMSVHTNASGGRGIESLYGKERDKPLAAQLSAELCRVTGWPMRRGDGTWYRPNVGVLRGTTMPAVLSECGFIDYPEENAAMSDPTWIERVAKAHLDIACKYLKEDPDGEEEEQMKLYMEDTGLRSPDGWTIYNTPAFNRDWWLDISNEHGKAVGVRVYANPRNRETGVGGSFSGQVLDIRDTLPGLHAPLTTLIEGLVGDWFEVSVHAEKPLSVMFGN